MSSRSRERKRRSFFKWAKWSNQPCWICGEDIDYAEPGDVGYRYNGNPWQFSIDHFHTIFERPDLEWEASNWRASHTLCNHRRGARPVALTVWEGSKELGRWKRKESDRKYHKRIANEDKLYGILTKVIKKEMNPKDYAKYTTREPFRGKIDQTKLTEVMDRLERE